MEIYVVMGSTGEYSDRTEWLVKAFASEEKAMLHVSALEKALLENGFKSENLRSRGRDDIVIRQNRMLYLDPNFACDYTGTRYYYHGVEYEE